MKLSLCSALRPHARPLEGNDPESLITHDPLAEVLAIAALRAELVAERANVLAFPARLPTIPAVAA